MKRSLFILFFLSCIAANAQYSFFIRVGSRTIGKDQSLQVEYLVSNADVLSDFKEPVFSDWEVLSGPMYSQQQMITNGKVDKTTGYVYILKARKLGTLVLPGTTASVGTKRLQCPDIRITVTKDPPPAGSASPGPTLPSLFDDVEVTPEDHLTISPGERVEDKIRQLVFIRAEASKTKCYAGEPIQVTYKLYTALRPDLQVDKQPSFSGAGVIELPFDDFPKTTEIRGRQYRVYTFRRVQLTPLQTGNLVLEPATVKVTLQYVTPTDHSLRSSTVMVNNTASNITVVAPPMLNGKEYDGPMGQFSLALRADNDTLPADATNNLIIELNGEGNFQNLKTPNITWPTGIQHFDESVSEELNKQDFPVQGRKLIKVPFVVSRKGNIHFDPVQVTVFNTATNKFETLTSNDLTLTITDAVKTQNIAGNAYDNVSNKKYLWLIPAIALIAGFVFIVSGKKKKKETMREEIKPAPVSNEVIAETISPVKIIQDQLHELSTQHEQREWLSTGKQVMKDSVLYYGEKISDHEFVILEHLHKANETVFHQYTNLVKTMNEVLYAPIPVSLNREETIEQIKSVCENLIGMKA